jgi:hypothetical protein
MCEKAKEIQNVWKPKGGDWYIHNYRGTTKLSRKVEKQIWGDDDKDWTKIEILCYQPSETKNYFVSTTGESSLVTSIKDLVKGHSIWLPCQDQLQEMVGCQFMVSTIIPQNIGWFYEWVHSNYLGSQIVRGGAARRGDSDFWEEPSEIFKTWEQLWLAFVMKDKYNKSWNGKDWVSNENNTAN